MKVNKKTNTEEYLISTCVRKNDVFIDVIHSGKMFSCSERATHVLL